MVVAHLPDDFLDYLYVHDNELEPDEVVHTTEIALGTYTYFHYFQQKIFKKNDLNFSVS